MIVRLLGRRIGYRALESKLQILWNTENFKILNLGNVYFLIKFFSHIGFQTVVLDGPWSGLGWPMDN